MLSAPAQSNYRACVPIASDQPPIDLVRLSRHTLGDRALEVELLTLFERQAARVMADLDRAAIRGEALETSRLAHKLCGSALAVGAESVAKSARRLERAIEDVQPDVFTHRIRAELGRAVAAACAAARSLAEDA